MLLTNLFDERKLSNVSKNSTFSGIFKAQTVRSFACGLCLFLFASPLFAKSPSMPEWVQNYKKVYPASKYLAQRGSGDSAEKAKTDATTTLSRYFQTNVNANLTTTLSSVTQGESVDEKTIVIDEVNVQSQVDFFGLEYTDPYYLKSEKKLYCVVYMDRAEAWLQYKPQIEMKKNSLEQRKRITGKTGIWQDYKFRRRSSL